MHLVFPEDRYGHVPHWWGLPRIKSLRFRPQASVGIGKVAYDLMQFCGKHGQKLVSLDLGGNSVWQHDTQTIEAELLSVGLCPNLKYLVIRASTPATMEFLKNSKILSKALEQIDIVAEEYLFPSQEVSDPTSHEGPAWKRVRYLDIRLMNWIPDLPCIVPHEGKRLIPTIEDHFGLKVRDAGSEVTLAFGPLYGDSPEKDDSDDPDYAPSSSEPSEYDSSDASELEDGEQWGLSLLPTYGDPEVKQITETEALVIYSRTLEQNIAD